MTQPVQYGEIIVSRNEPTVITAPSRALIGLELLRSMHGAFIPGPNLIHVGRTPSGDACVYQVTGWDTHHKALIVERWLP